MKNILYLAMIVALYNCAGAPSTSIQEMISTVSLEERLEELSQKAIADLEVYPIDSTQIPRSLNADGSSHATGSRDWTSGFYVGTLWNLYAYSNESALKDAAQQWTAFQEKEKLDTHTHDLGFKIYCSFGEGYTIEPNEPYRDVIIQASQTLIRRYNDQVGAIRSWDFNQDIWQFPVIIDNMMNLEMLFEATRLSGDSSFHQIAHQHALTTLENHFRADKSSYHVIDYDTTSGEVRNRHTHQGASHESSWARGQAWGLYGYTMAYRYTKDARLLEHANAIAHFFFKHPNLPEDKIPYWDFDAPKIPNAYRDASAAAIAASGLLELAEYNPKEREKYIAWADTVLLSLGQTDYQSDSPPFILQHSVGSIPSNSEVDVPLSYADYYYVEALRRRHAISLTQNN